MCSLRRIYRRLRRFDRDTSGAATVEFVIIAPLFLAIVLSVFESGWLTTKMMMLDRGLDITVRQLRLNDNTSYTHNQLKTMVCDNAAIFADCTNSILLEFVSLQTGTPISLNVNCVDRTGTIAPIVTFQPGAASEVMFVRACVIVDPIFPGLGLGLALTKDPSGGFAMVSYSAFVNEPV